MADIFQVGKRLKELMEPTTPPPGGGAQTQNTGDYEIRNIGGTPIVYIRTWSSTAWDPETETMGAYIWDIAPSEVQNRVLGRIPSEGGGDGDTITDPILYRLQQQQNLDIQAAEERRAAEMQPLELQQAQSNIEYQKFEEEYSQKNLERQLLADKFSRAQEAYESSRLAEALANEKKKTATSLLSSMVDNLVPPGMTSLPGIPGSTMPTVAQINWNQLGSGLDPQTDQALRYLIGLQQQNQGV